jgi:hypothetical protein
MNLQLSKVGAGEPVIMGRTDYDFLRDEMSFFQFEITHIRRGGSGGHVPSKSTHGQAGKAH